MTSKFYSRLDEWALRHEKLAFGLIIFGILAAIMIIMLICSVPISLIEEKFGFYAGRCTAAILTGIIIGSLFGFFRRRPPKYLWGPNTKKIYSEDFSKETTVQLSPKKISAVDIFTLLALSPTYSYSLVDNYEWMPWQARFGLIALSALVLILVYITWLKTSRELPLSE